MTNRKRHRRTVKKGGGIFDSIKNMFSSSKEEPQNDTNINVPTLPPLPPDITIGGRKRRKSRRRNKSKRRKH